MEDCLNFLKLLPKSIQDPQKLFLRALEMDQVTDQRMLELELLWSKSKSKKIRVLFVKEKCASAALTERTYIKTLPNLPADDFDNTDIDHEADEFDQSS
jgi:hypothetical protein